jgi:hypothetical protein
MMMQSIVALIERRHTDPDQLAFAPRQRPGTVHELHVQRVMLPHDRRMNRVDLDDATAHLPRAARTTNLYG